MKFVVKAVALELLSVVCKRSMLLRRSDLRESTVFRCRGDGGNGSLKTGDCCPAAFGDDAFSCGSPIVAPSGFTNVPSPFVVSTWLCFCRASKTSPLANSLLFRPSSSSSRSSAFVPAPALISPNTLADC